MKIRRESGTFQFEGDPFSKSPESISKFYAEVFLLMNCLHNKPLIKSMNMNFFYLYYTVIKNRDGKMIIEDYEKDYVHSNSYITSKQNIGSKIVKTVLG